MPDSIHSIPQPHYGPFTYRQPNLLPAALLASIIGPLSKSISENIDPHERARKYLEDQEIAYKTTLYGRQLENLHSGGNMSVDAEGVPLYNADGTRKTPEQILDYKYKKSQFENSQENLKKKQDGGTDDGGGFPKPTVGERAKSADIPAIEGTDFNIQTGVGDPPGGFGIRTGVANAFPNVIDPNSPQFTTLPQDYWAT